MNRRHFLKTGAVATGFGLSKIKAWANAGNGPDYFTLAVLPDTQNYSWKFPHVYKSQTKWIKENAEKYRIPFVCHEGDIVQFNDHAEWEHAVEAHKELDGNVPYGLNVGNHDYSWSWKNEKRDKMIREVSRIDQFFPPSKFAKESWWGGCLANSCQNSYQFFDGPGGLKFLVLNIEFVPRDEALAWGNAVLKKHPDCRAIIVTHAYMNCDNTRLEGRFGMHSYFPNDNNAGQMWNKLVRKHKNIFLVMSGHIFSDSKKKFLFDPSYTETGLLTSKGDHGNDVHQILADYQGRSNGGNGFLRLMRFVPEKNIIEVKSYSPFKDQWLTEPHNQFVLKYQMS